MFKLVSFVSALLLLANGELLLLPVALLDSKAKSKSGGHWPSSHMRHGFLPSSLFLLSMFKIIGDLPLFLLPPLFSSRNYYYCKVVGFCSTILSSNVDP